jgi:hypothetical protein
MELQIFTRLTLISLILYKLVYRLTLESPCWQDEHSHAQLAEQFKLHTISRVYLSLTCGLPSPYSARIEVPISRDPNNRIRMVAAPGSGHRYAKDAASRWFMLLTCAFSICNVFKAVWLEQNYSLRLVLQDILVFWRFTCFWVYLVYF